MFEDCEEKLDSWVGLGCRSHDDCFVAAEKKNCLMSFKREEVWVQVVELKD